MNQQSIAVIDAASLIMDVTGSGQPRASDEEVLEILALLLHRLVGVIIVVDGIDECVDVKGLLTTLQGLLSDTTCKLLLLGRPNVMFPAGYANIQSIEPRFYSNFDDIELYLCSEISELLTTVTIAGDLSAQEIAHIIAARSRSLFLFARSMVEYLGSPALTARQRMDEINNLTLVEGLDTMYERVTKFLMTRYASEKLVVRMIFQLAAVAKRPFDLEELRTALSLKVGQPANEDRLDSIENLEHSIVRMCGALVEITGDGKLQFIHASVKDFLTQQAQNVSSNFFYIDMSKANLMAARLCLSYLVCDMPSGPLSGYVEEAMDRELLQARLPLLYYSALSWDYHLAQGITYCKNRPFLETIKGFPDLAKFFSRFLLSKSRITTWIEASWTFGNEPTLSDSLDALHILGNEEISVEDPSSNLIGICKELGILSRDLVKLAADWERLLLKRPNEIWGSSVSAFNKSEFWVNTTHTRISSLFEDDHVSEEKPMLRVSKTSANGQLVGLIEVLNKRLALSSQAELAWAATDIASSSVQTSLEDLSSGNAAKSDGKIGLSVRYRVNAIDNAAQSLVDIGVPILNDDVQHIQPQLLQSLPSCAFQFPIAFGIDLQDIVVLHTIIRARQASGVYSGEVVRRFDSQSLDFQPPGIPRLKREYQEAEYPAWYRIWLSPARHFLALTKRRGKPEIVTQYAWGLWSVTVWRDKSQPHQGPLYEPLGEIYLNSTHLGKDGSIAFHPTLPMLVASGDIETVCWNFESQSEIAPSPE